MGVVSPQTTQRRRVVRTRDLIEDVSVYDCMTALVRWRKSWVRALTLLILQPLVAVEGWIIAPIGGVLAACDVSVKRQPWQVDNPSHQAMLGRVDVNVVDAPFQVLFITNSVLKESPLQHAEIGGRTTCWCPHCQPGKS